VILDLKEEEMREDVTPEAHVPKVTQAGPISAGLGKEAPANVKQRPQMNLLALAISRVERHSRLCPLGSIVHSMPCGLIVINTDGRIEAVNKRTEKLLGYAAKDLIGNRLELLFSAESRNQRANFMKQVLPKALGQLIELFAVRNNGEEVPVELSVSQLQVGDEQRLLVTVIDVTPRREIERLRREFLDMISHEIKTPLNSILGNLALVGADAFGELSERGKHIVSTSSKQAVRLIGLINDLLLLEKMEAGGFELRLTKTDLGEVLQQSIELVEKVARQRSIVIEAPKRESYICADSMRLVQVVVNLLSNAIKFSPNDSVVKVLIEERNAWTEVRVIDRGRGIPQTHRKAIFEKFKQVEMSDSREKGGAGLGLPICKLIIEQHGGTIGVTSKKGKGSTFWFRIPKKPEKKVLPARDCP
jgi:PAS domain S-box-containing protein